MTTELHRLGLHALSTLIAARKIGALELTEALIAHCEALDWTHAVITPCYELARETARARDNEPPRGPLHGIPVGLKDSIDLAGIPTRLCGRYTPQRSAVVWQALERAGAVPLAKLHCAGWCLGAPGPGETVPFARNPYHFARTPGASSSGSAVALATGMVPVALGTDTGGSIRIPAAFCRLVGLKPSSGLLSLRGVFPLAPSLDQVGPMARDSRDCALLMETLAPGVFATDRRERLGELRVGHVAHFGAEAGAGADQVEAVGRALSALIERGATVVDVTLPPLQSFADCFLPLMLSEAHALHAEAVAHDPDMPHNTRVRLKVGATVSPEAVARARDRRRTLIRALDALWSEVDALVYPIVPDDPPRIETIDPLAYMAAPMLAVPANLTGGPSVSVPCGTSRAGLPVGIQIVAPRHGDALALRLARACEHPRAPVTPVQDLPS